MHGFSRNHTGLKKDFDNWPLFKNKRLLFSHNKKTVSPNFLQNMILPAVAIKLHCFRLLFEHHFCLNNRPFVFSITDNNFILVAIATKFAMKRNSFAKF